MGTPEHCTPFHELLAEEGFRPKLLGEGDEAHFTFKCEGHIFSLWPDADAPGFLLVKLDYEEQPHSMAELLRRCNANNREWKVVKSMVDDDRSVVFSFEGYFDEAFGAAALLARALEGLRFAASAFFREDEVAPAALGMVKEFAN